MALRAVPCPFDHHICSQTQTRQKRISPLKPVNGADELLRTTSASTRQLARYAANSDRTRGAQPGLFPILRFLSQTALRLLILLRFGLLLLFSYLLFLHPAFVFLPAFVSHGGSFPCAIYP